MSNVMNKIKAKVDQALHPNDTTTTTTTTHHHPHTSTTTHHHPHTTTTNPAVHNAHTGPATHTAGPHSSNLANKMNPTVDSDLDGSHNRGVHPTGGAYSTSSTGTTQTNPAVYGAGTGPATHTAGPHSSNIANKVDPRVDSDLDASHRNAAHPTGGAFNSTHTAHPTGGAFNSTHTNTYGAGTGPATTTAGPHSSNIANKLDPRIDSDLDGSRNGGMAQTGPGAVHNHTTGPATHTAGPYTSNFANKLDPSVNSTNSHHTAVPHSTTGAAYNSGPGPAPNTQGPHSSDMMNKLDPRVNANPTSGSAVHNSTTGYNNNSVY